MAFLSGLGDVKLKAVSEEDRRDRSGAKVDLAGADVLADEAERWKYFFDTGCSTWFELLKEVTFRSSFIDLHREEAQVIVDHWEERRRALAKASADGELADLEALLQEAQHKLEPLAQRLDAAVRTECEASAAGLAFVKLSTRSPKDSQRAIARAEVAYQAQLEAAPPEVAQDDNERWKILATEVTRAGAVSSGAQGVELLLDSDRVWEDLEFALRGPKTQGDGGSSGQSQSAGAPYAAYNTQVVARAWDPRLTLQSEFRGIVWEGKLTCLGQYFHPLVFRELADLKATIQADCLALFAKPAVQKAVQALGGHCIVDFAWLGNGEVIIVELNPFDGVCLGTFPASTGMFLWDDEKDRAIMKGEAPFETRIREARLRTEDLKVQCNPDWRRIIYRESRA